MAAHLWTDADPPIEYIELFLCRDVYHCLRSELRKEDALDVIKDLAILDAEASVRQARNRFKK